ncbi:hypothetical protein, conserved [Eimeria brunetti]|uniref:Uncharacterized protein n=1 Tax=Eimeria brunetti TaxID=51314 RepID=U6LS07_9EIME|nr:hypothetical protein, conserved [Eimeria brunetti]
MATVKYDANASIKVFRSLLPSLPTLRPIFHKVVALADKGSLVGESAVPFGTPLFEALPPAVLFVGFESAEVYQAQFKLRNKDRFSRRVHAITPDSANFSVMSIKGNQASTAGRVEVRPLQGTVTEGAVTLSTSLLKFDTTFVNLTSEKTVCIENDTSEHLPFWWCFGPPNDTEDELGHHREFVSSGCYSIKPAYGRVWAKSSQNIRIEFAPIQATTYNSIALLNIAGRETGLKLQLHGTGTGPQVKFTKAELDFGDVVVYTEKVLDAEIVNTGDIAASYSVKPYACAFPPGTEVNFSPSSGCICINKAERVQASFRPAFVGEFEATVLWAIEASPEDIVLKLKGKVVPPRIDYDVSSIDFGVIPFGFEEVRSVQLTNTSDAPQTIEVKVLKRLDDTYGDIRVTPDILTIPAGSSEKVDIILCPSKAQAYIEEVAFGLSGLIDKYFILPLRGSSKTPQVALEPEGTLVFDDVFINTTARKAFMIRNTSRLSAQFSVTLEQGGDDVGAEVSPSDGLVSPLSAVAVSVILHPHAPGDVQITCWVSIAGLDNPFQLEVSACVSGPKLKIEPKELQWGKIKCLDEVAQQAELTNISPIPALVRCCVRSKHGYFTVQNPEITLEGGASVPVHVVATFLEAVASTGQLIVSAVDGQSLMVHLKGQAVGSPVVLKDFGSCTDFQQVCTSNPKRKTFELLNRGSRPRQVHFLDGSRNTYLRQANDVQQKFKVQPSEFLLGPDSSMEVTIEALSTLPGRASQVIICQESFGPGTTPVRIARTVATADFFTPTLVATPSSLAFKGSLEISFKEHPRVDVMSLEGETEFPNVELETTMLDFGFIVNETTKRIPLRMRNVGCAPVTYSWFLTDTYSVKDLKSSENNDRVNSEGSGVPISKIFDFTPFTGVIEPGAVETVHVRFWGVPNREASAVALCSIGQGPEYPVRLIGRASSPRLKVSQTEFDFGELPYLKPVTAEVILANGGFVDLSFAVDLERVSRPWAVEVSKRKGLIRANEKFKLDITFMTGIPAEITEQIFVEVDHCDPIAVTLRGRGTYRCLLIGLPRAPEDSSCEESDQRAPGDPTENGAASAVWQQAAEVDRQKLCKIMLEQYNASANFANWRLPGEETSFVATPGKYILDFGSVVVGQSKTRVVQLRNASPQTFGVKISRKDLQGTGFHVDPDVISRLHPNEQTAIAVSAKQDREGDANVLLTAFVSGSLSYQITLKGKFVVPDLCFHTDTLEFGSVKRGLCKTLTLRLRNQKSVPAQWRYRGLVDKGDKAQRDALRCFTIDPRQSVVDPGAWIDLKVQFFPEKAEKEVCARLIFCIEDNPKWKCITATGSPKLPRLEFIPSFVDFGHSLPSHMLRQDVIVRNNSDEPYEIYSLEFDEQYKQTNALLRCYQGFDESGIALLPVRPPGKSCWSRVRKAALQNAVVDGSFTTDLDGLGVKTDVPNSARGRLQNVSSEPGPHEQQIVESSSDESADEGPQEFPYRVLPPYRQSAIILGPLCSGKRCVAAHIGGEARRQLTLDECVEWAIAASGKKKKLETAGAENARLVEELIRSVEAQEGEPEATGGKKSGKAKIGKGDRRAEASSPGIPLHLLAAAVKLRAAQPDCYAGTVFRIEPSSYCASLADEALSIVRGLQNEDIVITIIKFGQPDCSQNEGEPAPNPIAEGVAFYKGLLAKQLQREREIGEQLDGGKGMDNASKPSASTSQLDMKKKRPPSSVGAESHPPAVHLTDGSIESLKHELQSLQQSRQRFEGYFSTSKLAQSFVQDQVAAYSCAEAELLKEVKAEMEQSPFPSSSRSGSRRSSQRTSLSSFQRLVTFCTGYANSSQPIDTLLAQLQPLREPVVPREPPVPAPEFLEVVHYPSSSPALEPPAKFFLFAPLPSTALERAEEEESKNRSKKPKDGASTIPTRSKIKQEKGGEDESLAARLTVEPGFTKASRWTLQPQTEQRLLLKCYVDEEGELACTLHFSVGVFDWGPLLAGRSTANVKSLYSKMSSAEEIDLVTIPPELCDFVTPLTLQNGSPFTTTVKGSFAGTSSPEVSAEAFCIDAGIELPSKTRVFEFGKVQAYQEAEIPYTVFNRGNISSPRLRNLLTLTPQSGEVKPGEQRKGVARISARHEVELVGTEELAVTIKDVESGCLLEPPQPPLQVTAIVAFNEVSLSPPRGLNFGPVESGKTSLLSFELENKGRFPFDWYLVNQECMFTPPEEPVRGAETLQKAEKQRPGKAKLQGKSPEKSIGATFGPFKIVPVRGQLDPGTKASVQVEYGAQGDASHSISLALLVNGVRMGHADEVFVSSIGPIAAFFADPSAPIDFETYGPIKPAATYFIQGQSSVPCISLEPEKLFHEQALATSMDEAYAVWQKRSGTIFVQDENCLCFGPIIVGSPGSASAVVETIRIDNPQLIPAEIIFEIKQQQVAEESAFDVQPKRIVVAPHDYAHATLSFKPASIQQYSSSLRIAVEKSANPLTGQAQFELRGEGTLPSITLAFPTSVNQKDAKPKSHLPYFDFGRVAVSRKVTIPIVVKNEGIITATARLQLPTCDSIEFDMPHSVTLKPKEERNFSLAYWPKTPGELDYKFRITTHANPFENVEIQVRGYAFSEELVWSAVSPANQSGIRTSDAELLDGNHLIFGDVPLGKTVVHDITLRNISTQAISFDMNMEALGQLRDKLIFTPAGGTLAPNTACLVNLSFKSNDPINVIRHPITFTASFLQGSENSPASSKAPQKVKGRPKNKQADSKSEGVATGRGDAQSPEELTLFITVASDVRQCELGIERIDFEATSLFKSRLFSFTVTNTSAVSLPYEIFFEKGEERDDPCFFKVVPCRGHISSGGQQNVQIAFSPKEMAAFDRTLVCSFPNLVNGPSRISIPVTATAIRPICHLEIPPTDYLERRSHNSPIPLPDNVAVLEIEGIGVGVRHTRRIHVHNPTAYDIDFECEPHVTLETSRINFSPTIVGRTVEEKVLLCNKESIPISFQFDRTHLEAAGTELKITPLSGSVPPESFVPVRIQMTPYEQKNISVSIPCKINQKFRNLRLDIKGEGYYLSPSLKLVEEEAERTLEGDSESFDFGCVLAGQTKQVLLKLSNNGKYDFSFRWITKDSKSHGGAGSISIEPIEGYVPKGQVLDCIAVFTPVASTSFQSLQATCEVQGKKICKLLLTGSCTTPKVSFSFTSHDFGALFLPQAPDVSLDALSVKPRISSRVVLKITNTDLHHQCSISSPFSPTDAFDFQPLQVSLSPEEVLEIPITFNPRETKLYKAKIPFFVNDQLVATIQLSGKGIPIRLEAQATDNGIVKLQPVLRGKGSCRSIRIINLSEKAVLFYLMSPDGDLRLRPPSVAFGQVVVGSWMSQDVLLSNIGELPMAFRFSNSDSHPDLVSISPSHGTLQPRANQPVTVTFRPIKPTEQLEIDDIICFGHAICGPKEPHTEVARLNFTVTGQSVPLPADALHVLKFTTSVRSPITKTFFLKNPKKVEWTTTPSLSVESPKDGNYFSCQPAGPITIPPQQKVALQLTYHPMTMTLEAGSQEQISAKGIRRTLPSQHTATLFCALPAGEACCIRMVGTASEPTVEQTVETVATCKQQTTVNIKIRNWLDTRQTFNVGFTTLQPSGGQGIQIQAPAFIDVAGGQAREYRFTAFALKPCNALIRFQFTNPSTGDFTLAEAKIQFIEGGWIDTIFFEGNTRQLFRHRLEIENVSNKRAVIQCTSAHQEIAFSPQPFTIAPQATGVLEVLMRATTPGTGETSVALTSEELGLFKYLVKYDMRNPGIEKRITCSAPLGRDTQQSVRFVHFGKKATTYQLTLEWPVDSQAPQKTSALHEIFSLETKAIQVPADTDGQGVEICIPVKFVPSRLQDTKVILCARGPEGQEYRVDQAAFALDKKSFRLEPRKSTTITVSLKTEARATGRLIINAETVPKWIFYLKTD